jgi:hypothetical protein
MKCIHCNKETKNPKYCGRSCAAIANNKKFPKRNLQHQFRNCLFCAKELYHPKIYCDNKCQRSYKFAAETLPNFLRGNLTTVSAKKCIIHLNGNLCQICGNVGTHNNKPLTLQLDHIDGNSDNNNPDNLRLLCPNCHTQTITYTGRNIKNTKRNSYLKEYKQTHHRVSVKK